jgi:hypothetical protein
MYRNCISKLCNGKKENLIMDMDTAATVLAGSVLTGLAFIVAVITIVIINNLFHRYWKPIQWMRMQDHPLYVHPVEEVTTETSTTTNTVTSATVVLQQK